MLVLSRRVDETVVFPNLGITVKLLRVQGRVAQLGIDAPAHFAVLRGELAAERTEAEPLGLLPADLAHQLRNRLNRIALHLHLFRRQQEQGLFEEAERSLTVAVDALEALDREWLTPTPTAADPPRSLRALIVDDDDNERELLAGLLRMNGADCVTAADGEAALDFLAQHERPDVVLLDMRMPRCGGPATLTRIRQDPRLRDLRVFSVSGLSPEQAGVPTGPEGIDGWFCKPLNPGQLWQAIVEAVGRPG